jgi:tripartite-type tricarboxylate transporter receptor subunit TctC
MTRDSTYRRKFLKAAGAAGIVGLAGCTGGDGGDGGGDGGDGGDGGGGGGGDTPEDTPEDTPTDAPEDTPESTPEEGEFDLDFDWTPDRNVSIIVPWGAGGGTDTMTRGVMNPAEDILRQNGVDVSINVQNITGAGGLNATSYVQSQPADGHTIFANTTVVERNIVQGNANFTLDDWMGVSRVQHDTSWWYSSGRDGTGHDTLDSVLDKARDDPPLQIGAVGGGISQVFSLRVAEEAGILDNVQFVTYDDAGQMRNDVISGETDVAIGEIQEIQPQVESGDVKLLLVGVTDDQLDEFPDVVTTGSRGWDVTYGVQRGFVAWDGTPQEAIDFWDKLVRNAIQTESYQRLEQETLLYLREGYLGPEEWKEAMAGQIETLEQSLSLWEQVSG